MPVLTVTLLISVSSYEVYIVVSCVHMKYLAYVAYIWHLSGIFLIGSYMIIAWQLKVGTLLLYFSLLICAVMWGLHVEYIVRVVRHTYDMGQVDLFRGMWDIYVYQCCWSHN